MMSKLMPLNEAARLEALAYYGLLDTPPEAEFDRITALAAKFFNVPIAHISLVDKSRQWQKSSYGVQRGETPREMAFCARTILENVPLIVPDATADERFASNPLVTGLSHIRFYAGAPLSTVRGANLGALCLIDTVPRSFSDSDAATLTQLAAMVVAAFEARVVWHRLQQELAAREHSAQALEHAKEEAERANLAKSDFLSRMSHELRTPLNAILGFSQLLETSDLTLAQQESVSHVLRGGRHLLDLIDEVLDIARIEAGKIELALEPVNAAAALEEAVAFVRPLAMRRAISLDVGRGDQSLDGITVLADRLRLQQVLLNLLSNAIKYNRSSGRVDVACVQGSADGCVRLSIQDTGLGISTDDLPKLFSPFERLDAATAGVEGTGIGLAISKSLVEAMDGSISVESVLGHGSTFSVALPMADGVDQQWKEQNPSRIYSAPDGSTEPATHTVLYIEDNASNLLLVKNVLARRTDIELLSAVTGVCGQRLAREREPDLILLDLHLPDLSGDSLLLALKADPRTREIPVVLVSADATSTQIRRLLALGAESYLTKPLNIPTFLRTIDTALAMKSGK